MRSSSAAHPTHGNVRGAIFPVRSGCWRPLSTASAGDALPPSRLVARRWILNPSVTVSCWRVLVRLWYVCVRFPLDVVDWAAMKRHNFRAGDCVIVRSPEEILSTLDADGTLDGLPFMPEMLGMCGKSFRVERRAEQTCVSVAPPAQPHRRFAADDVVFLDGPRCDGGGHDGCMRGCKVFWKEAWLRPVDSLETPTVTAGVASDRLRSRLRTKSDETHYFCQSTQLSRATEALPTSIRGLWRLPVAAREIRNGDRSLPEILKLLGLWSWQRLLHAVHGEQWLRGPHVRAPAASLELQPGEPVRVKSRAALVATLDARRSNRGLRICSEMTRCCGARAEVRDRFDRMVDQQTGEMREIRDSVTIQNVRGKVMTTRDMECLCSGELGDCPRGELMYWREIWLERAK